MIPWWYPRVLRHHQRMLVGHLHRWPGPRGSDSPSRPCPPQPTPAPTSSSLFKVLEASADVIPAFLDWTRDCGKESEFPDPADHERSPLQPQWLWNTQDRPRPQAGKGPGPSGDSPAPVDASTVVQWDWNQSSSLWHSQFSSSGAEPLTTCPRPLRRWAGGTYHGLWAARASEGGIKSRQCKHFPAEPLPCRNQWELGQHPLIQHWAVPGEGHCVPKPQHCLQPANPSRERQQPPQTPHAAHPIAPHPKNTNTAQCRSISSCPGGPGLGTSCWGQQGGGGDGGRQVGNRRVAPQGGHTVELAKCKEMGREGKGT